VSEQHPHTEIHEPWADDDGSEQSVAADEQALAGEAEASPRPDGTDETSVGEASASPTRIAELERERDEYLAGWQRTQADFENYRKRALRDQQAFAARASERLVGKLLPVLDDLERAIEAAEHHEEAKVIEGVEMTKSALAAALASEGVEEIPADGVFDPHVHEALLTQPAEGVEPGVIVQVVQRGYRLGDVVLRPARVIVAE
jgi:molecular chaperone GrpE